MLVSGIMDKVIREKYLFYRLVFFGDANADYYR